MGQVTGTLHRVRSAAPEGQTNEEAVEFGVGARSTPATQGRLPYIRQETELNHEGEETCIQIASLGRSPLSPVYEFAAVERHLAGGRRVPPERPVVRAAESEFADSPFTGIEVLSIGDLRITEAFPPPGYEPPHLTK